MTFSCDEVHIEAMINALVRMVLEFVVLFVVYFWLLGQNTNLDTSWLFFATFYALSVFVVPVQVQYELAGKYAQRWLIAANPTTHTHSGEINLWRILLPYSLPLAMIGATGLALFQVWFFSPTWLVIAVLAAASLLTVLPLVILLNRKYLKPLYQSTVSPSANSSALKENHEEYYFTHHVFPWLPVTLITSILILYKMSEESLFSTGRLDILQSALFVGSTCYISCLWMCYESVSQTRVDLKLGRFKGNSEDSINSTELLFLIHLLVVAAIGITYILGYWLWPQGFSQLYLIIIGALLVCLCGAGANILGVTWACSTRQAQLNEDA